MPTFAYEKIVQTSADTTTYRKLSGDFVKEVQLPDGRTLLEVSPEGLTLLAKTAFADNAFYLRSAHLEALKQEIADPESSDNDKFVCYTHLQNAVIAANGVLPICQDTGTAQIMAWRGKNILTDGLDAQHLSQGIFETFQEKNLRYSQLAPLEIFKEKNTGTNLPAQIDIYSDASDEYRFLCVAKGGGSANKMFLYQASPAVLNEQNLTDFITKKLADIGTSACPPYHLVVVIGGTSADNTMKMVKLASTKYLDSLPTTGSEGGRAFRDIAWEAKVLKIAQGLGIGAQFGGKHFAHDVRVIRMPRHAASCPIGIGVSCSADRNIKAKINKDGIFIEQLETNPAQYLPKVAPEMAPPVVIDLNQGMENVRKLLSQFPVKTRLSLHGSMIVARDAAHARIKAMLEAGQPMPEYFKQFPVYYAGPAKTPLGMATGSFGPTTAGRMDSFVDLFQSHGGSMVMLAKGNRSQQVTDACKKWGGFYLGSIGGPAASLALNNIKKVEVIDFEDLGMEAIRKIEVENFPAFIVVDDKGNDFFSML
jgi:fumarate hydratase class I